MLVSWENVMLFPISFSYSLIKLPLSHIVSMAVSSLHLSPSISFITHHKIISRSWYDITCTMFISYHSLSCLLLPMLHLPWKKIQGVYIPTYWSPHVVLWMYYWPSARRSSILIEQIRVLKCNWWFSNRKKK